MRKQAWGYIWGSIVGGLLFLALTAIATAILTPASSGERSASAANQAFGSSVKVPNACSTNYTIATASGTIVAGTTDTGNHGDGVVTQITLPFPVQLYDQSFATAAVGSNGIMEFASLYNSDSNV